MTTVYRLISSRKKLIICIATILPLFLGAGCSNSSSSGISNPQNPYGLGPAGVNLSANGGNLDPQDAGSSGNYVILAKTGISNVPGSAITGNIAVSPAAASYITGFSLVADATNVFSTSTQVVGGGKVYAANYAVPTPANLTSAIGSMETSYTDAASRSNPNFSELATGNIGGLTLAPGLYKWMGNVTIPTSVTISGSATDVWIFQISQDLLMSAATNITLAGGAQEKNIYWQVAGQVVIGTGSHFEGIILAKTSVELKTSASMVGQIYSQTMVMLDQNAVTKAP